MTEQAQNPNSEITEADVKTFESLDALALLSPAEREEMAHKHFFKIMTMTGFKDLSEEAVKATMTKTFNDIKKALFLGDAKRKDVHGRVSCRKINVFYNNKDFIIVKVSHVGRTPEVYKHPITNEPLRGCSFFCPQSLQPEYEFFKPTTQEIERIKDGAWKEYCKRGGFLFRPIAKKKEALLKPSLK